MGVKLYNYLLIPLFPFTSVIFAVDSIGPAVGVLTVAGQDVVLVVDDVVGVNFVDCRQLDSVPRLGRGEETRRQWFHVKGQVCLGCVS